VVEPLYGKIILGISLSKIGRNFVPLRSCACFQRALASLAILKYSPEGIFIFPDSAASNIASACASRAVAKVTEDKDKIINSQLQS
jgi:hypothetical protein